jgi:uncharacterized membrane protein
MSADAAAAPTPTDSPRFASWPWELILLVLALVALALIPVEIHRAFGLPAHPLIIHIPVILVPLVGLAALALMAVPSWMPRWGLITGVFALAAEVGTIVAVGAGEAFKADRGNFASARLHAHQEAGETLRILMILFALALLGTLWARRQGVLNGVGFHVARVVVVIRTGHLGAELTWGDRGGQGGGGPPAGFQQQQGSGSGGAPQGFTPPSG